MTQTWCTETLPCTQTTAFLWEVVQVQTPTLTQGFKGQTVCFPRFTPYYLFMKQRGREGGTRRRREMERNPPAWSLWCGKKISFFNLPSNGTHMTHPEPARTLPVFTCLCLHVLRTHTWVLWCPHVCVREEENEITCCRLNSQGGNGQRKY